MFELEIIMNELQKERIREAETHRLIQEFRSAVPKEHPISNKLLADIGQRISNFGDLLQYKFGDSGPSINIAPLGGSYAPGSKPTD